MSVARGRQTLHMSAIKRISADITELAKPLYADTGIFYATNEQNMYSGYACVFGPKDTPYEDCPMLYEVKMPTTFPFDNPNVEFKTYYEKTRFHPNMYVEGKCCLSILGTWSGPKWASTMRLSTIFVTLQSLMDTDPIRHEPGYANPDPEMSKEYAAKVEHSCMQYILQLAETEPAKQKPWFQPFQEVFQKRLPDILTRLEARLLKYVQEEERPFKKLPYSMGGDTHYRSMLKRTLKLKAILNSTV